MTTRDPILPSAKEPIDRPSWRRFFIALLDRSPVSGTVDFDGRTSPQSVLLNPAQQDADYAVLWHRDGPDQDFWATSLARTGFVANTSNAAGLVHYTIIRR